jgi:Flp pilus assembly protein TadD
MVKFHYFALPAHLESATNSRYRHGLGTIYQRENKLDLAEYHFVRASEINPTSVMISYVGHVSYLIYLNFIS